MKAFRVLFSDDHFVAIDKPAGFHSHPPEDKTIPLNANWNALEIAQRQVQQKLFPCHRIDKATSGILLFAKSSEAASEFQQAQIQFPWKKQYFAFVRGHCENSLPIETPLKDENGILKSASTEINPVYIWKCPTSLAGRENRFFTLLEARPKTGRFHQIRRHLNSIAMPIVGDQRHGDKKLNRDFFSKVPTHGSSSNTPYLYLRFAATNFFHPLQEEKITIAADWPRQWHYLFESIEYCALRGQFASN